MWAAFIFTIFLYMPVNANKCDSIDGTELLWKNFHQCTVVNLTNKGINNIVTNGSSYDKISKLDLSNNKIRILPEEFLTNASELTDVHLQDNNLEGLPGTFLKNSFKLQILKLEGNQLTKIPGSVFHDTLRDLTLDCKCELVNNLVVQINASKYPTHTVKCKLSSEWTNPWDYKEKCDKQYLALCIVLPILVIALIAGGVALYIWKRKTSSSGLESKGGADKSPDHGQSRYTPRNKEGTATTLNPGHTKDYENVFVGNLPTTETKPYGYLKNEREPGTHSKHTAVDDTYLECDVNEGDQPIYTNTQGIYYNYSEPRLMKSRSKEEEDVYILPDQ